jgi:phosphoribosylaminoimidazolecarboxamide formyltransferase/IMP cyclohydrolase
VAVNLYPFRETVAKGDVTVGEAMEQVDIGGPTMIRAAAKSHRDVSVVVDPTDYDAVIAALDGAEAELGPLRRRLAAKAFQHTSAYDAAITGFLSAQDGEADVMPEHLVGSLQRVQVLRYGENPDQKAAFYGYDKPAGLAALQQHHGKELSYNNLLDLDGALLSLSPFVPSAAAAVCIIKHTTPCGMGVGASVEEAYWKALATDPTSAFGSAIAVSQTVDDDAAAAMSELFIECVVAPAFTPGAMATLTKKKNIRVLTFPEGDASAFVRAYGTVPEPRMLRSVYGGMLVQTPPEPPFYAEVDPSWTVATKRQPTDAEWEDLRFAWAAIFGVKSNAILLAK